MCRILVADDDQDQLDLRKLLLEAAGHDVTVALDPHETIRRLQQSEADLVLMDLRFPNSTGKPDAALGLALIRRIRDAGCRAPVIVLSGWPDDLYGQPEEKMVSRIMIKPVNPGVLVEAIGALAPL
ncbi:MAG TPA: response regulator [Candidatus Acidoferrales bacterium]|jgi:CheY-like chemotaxis protein|nr:response regulator [Candidatus Acidoferrales bacterium]